MRHVKTDLVAPPNYPTLGLHINPAGERRAVMGYTSWGGTVLVRWESLEGVRESSLLEWSRWQAKKDGTAAVVPVAAADGSVA